MSTIRVDNLQASDGLSPAFAAGGVAKARTNYDQVAVSVTSSDNVTSVTDNATGRFIVNLTNAMADANDTRQGQVNDANTAPNSETCNPTEATASSTASAQEFLSGATTTLADYATTYTVFHGDLA